MLITQFYYSDGAAELMADSGLSDGEHEAEIWTSRSGGQHIVRTRRRMT